MMQRYRRKAQLVDAEDMGDHYDVLRDGAMECRGKAGFEREYEPIPSEGDVSRSCMLCEQTAKSIELADTLAEIAIEEPEDHAVTTQDNWVDRLFIAADAYLDSRKGE